MPELPDLTVVADALHAALAGRPVRSADGARPARGPRHAGRAGRPWPARRVESIRRRGKFLLIDLERDEIAVNPMLTGRFQLAAPGDKLPTKTAVVLGFGPRARWPAPTPPTWTRGAAWLPADDAQPEVRYRDPTQMGKVYLRPAGVDRPIPGLGAPEQGPDADDPALTLEVWRERIRRHPGELKNLLRNQSFVAGIGNAYSDEILHAAGLLPFRKRSSLAAEEVDALYDATRTTLGDAIDVLRERVPPTFETPGARLPRGPRQGRPALPALRDADHRGPGRRVHHVVLPRLPALTPPTVRGSCRTWPILRLDGSVMPLSWVIAFSVVPNRAAIPISVSPDLTL